VAAQSATTSRIGGTDLFGMAATIGAFTVGAALIEAALVPGIVIGGAVVLAPKLMPGLSRRLPRWAGGTAPATPSAPASEPFMPKAAPAAAAVASAVVERFGVKQAVIKTITFRLIVTTLDFTTNYIILGQANTAAGLSAIGLVAGPVFYFIHEAAWNYFGASVTRSAGSWGTSIDLPFLPSFGKADTDASGERRGFRINQSLAKTITFRTFATAMDFTVTYLVVGNALTALTLSSIGFVVGPFVYIGHEMAWDRWGTVQKPEPVVRAMGLLPAPA
jgi:uncharacterized membrane protein